MINKARFEEYVKSWDFSEDSLSLWAIVTGFNFIYKLILFLMVLGIFFKEYYSNYVLYQYNVLSLFLNLLIGLFEVIIIFLILDFIIWCYKEFLITKVKNEFNIVIKKK